MAQRKSVFDEIDEEAEKRAIAKARAEIAAGRGVPHEKARVWLLKLRGGKVELSLHPSSRPAQFNHRNASKHRVGGRSANPSGGCYPFSAATGSGSGALRSVSSKHRIPVAGLSQ